MFVLALVLSWTSVVWCAPPVLVIVRTSDLTDPTPFELRLRSELAAEGINAIVTNPVEPGGDARPTAARFGANAIIDVTVSANEIATTIWAGDANINIEVNRQLRVSNLQRDAVAVFALRTVDFLQGARLELEQQRRAKYAAANANATNGRSDSTQSPPPTTLQTNPDEVKPTPAHSTRVSRGEAPRVALRSELHRAKPKSERYRVELGLALLLTTDRFHWATSPSLSASYRFDSRWMVGATFAGPFVNHVNTTSGQYRITVDQELLQFEFGRCLPLNSRLDLEPFVGVGGSRYAADGRASPAPLVGHYATAWSLYNAMGSRLVWHLGPHLHFVGDVAGFGRWQAPRVQVDIGDLTGSSRWNLLMKLTLGWSF